MTRIRKILPYLLALLITAIYFGLPLLVDYLATVPHYARYAERDLPRIAEGIQSGLVYPLGKWVSGPVRDLLVFPYWLCLFLGIAWLYRRTYPAPKYLLWISLAMLFTLYLFPNTLLYFESDRPSLSYGSVRDGRVEGAKRLPFRGDNFTTYSFTGYLLGRTYVHERVRKVILEAFEQCRLAAPEAIFVIGETGLPSGGAFHPHRTHQNGLSVDIMTPLLRKDRPYRSYHLFNLWGYSYEFDDKGYLDARTRIDYETLGKLMLAIREAAGRNGLTVEKVIFDPVLRPPLFATEAGKKLRDLPFTRNRIILRHDDHFHFDFGL